MNISRRGHNTRNGSAVHHILAVIHNDNFSNTALRGFIFEIRHSHEPAESTWVMKGEFQACVKNVILVVMYIWLSFIMLHVSVHTIQISGNALTSEPLDTHSVFSSLFLEFLNF